MSIEQIKSVFLYKCEDRSLEEIQEFSQIVEKIGEDFNFSDSMGNTPLHYAVMRKDREFLDIIKFLINEKKANINVQNKQGQTPLYHALLEPVNMTLVKYLLEEANADPKIEPFPEELPEELPF